MNITDAVVLVTGANRGLGQAFVDGLLAASAAQVYETEHGVYLREAVH